MDQAIEFWLGAGRNSESMREGDHFEGWVTTMDWNYLAPIWSITRVHFDRRTVGTRG